MKAELLKYLLIEESRLHSALGGYKNFFFYPAALFFGTGVTTFLLARYSTLGGNLSVALGVIIFFFMFGFVSGSFGLHATDYLERRFGDFGKLFSNMLVQPIALRDVFLMTAISDAIFYFGWSILPLIGGSALGVFLAGGNITTMPLLLLCVSLAFLLGVGVSFFLSVLITKSKIIFSAVIVLLVGIYLIFRTQVLLPYMLYMHFSLISLLLNILLILLFFTMTALIIGNEYSIIKEKGKYTSFNFGRKNQFLSKDYIDLKRTHGLIAKPLFNVLIPSVLLLVLLSTINIFQGNLFLVTHNLIFVSIMLGTMSVNFFNVLLSGDSFSYYVFLPISLRDFIWPKLLLAEIICGFQGIILLMIYASMNSIYINLWASVVLLLCFIFYTICINFSINGLKPNENALNVRSLGWLTLLFLPVVLIGLLLPFFFSSSWIYVLFSGLLIAAGYFSYSLGIRRWREVERY